MGRDWHWTRPSKKPTTDGDGDGAGNANPPENRHVAGCMSGFFHLFDLHHVLFSTRHVSDESSPSPTAAQHSKGVEAPRNSLELDVAEQSTTSSKAADDYEIPYGRIQVVPKNGSLKEQMEEERSLQGLSTARSSVAAGNVVARLMGLDGLPLPLTSSAHHRSYSSSFSPRTHCYRDESLLSPSPVETQKRKQKKSTTPPPRRPLQPRNTNMMAAAEKEDGTRSLPETPRMSFARRSWDSDPRLSLQSSYYSNTNKENQNHNISAPAMRELKSVAVGDHSPATLLMKTKHDGTEEECCSSRIGKIEREMKNIVGRRLERGRLAKASSEIPAPSKIAPEIKAPAPQILPSPPKRMLNSDRFNNERLKKPLSTSPSTKSTKTHKSPAPLKPPRMLKPPHINIRADIQKTHVKPENLVGETGPPATAPPPAVPEELEYVKKLFSKAGLQRHTSNSLPSFLQWNSPSHPLDPILFHQLELTGAAHSGTLRHRCNRKLLFDLVDEILGELLHPYRRRPTNVLDVDILLLRLWSRVRSFPAMNCQVMQDIDKLVEMDIPTTNVRQLLRHAVVKEEVRIVGAEVERWIFDGLLVENAGETTSSDPEPRERSSGMMGVR